jgi:ATP-binding cassette, subfamily B, bacterial CvaB/MchF/RaxB
MPMQINTLIGDMGSSLSGGQRQRLLLARALYRNPRILLLDEATSSLDVACERKIHATLQSMKITRIIVTHRPDTMALADRVIVLSRGGAKEITAPVRDQVDLNTAAI